MDEWDGSHTVHAWKWTSASSSFHITQYSNTESYALAQNDALNEWNPELWSRFDWTWDTEGALYYCQSAYAAETEEEAIAAAADNQDLVAGCSGFSWSKLTAM